MNIKKKSVSKILGNLDILVVHNEDEFEGKISTWEEILIHGDPAGLIFCKFIN